MKFTPLLLIPFLSATPAQAGWKEFFQPGFSESEICYKNVYREEYVPGTYNNPGYVDTFKDRVEIPCNTIITGGGREPHSIGVRPSRPSYRPYRPSRDGNECGDGKIAGGLLGGGLAAAISQGDGRWWAIPLGAVVGSHIGCDIDGG